MKTILLIRPPMSLLQGYIFQPRSDMGYET